MVTIRSQTRQSVPLVRELVTPGQSVKKRVMAQPALVFSWLGACSSASQQWVQCHRPAPAARGRAVRVLMITATTGFLLTRSRRAPGHGQPLASTGEFTVMVTEVTISAPGSRRMT